MNLFTKLKANITAIQKIANAVSNVQQILDRQAYESHPRTEEYLIAAWICRVGILDIIDSPTISTTHTLWANINGRNTRMTVVEAYARSVGRLCIKADSLDSELKDAIFDVLEKGDLFYEIDSQIPEQKKRLFQLK